MNNNIYNKILDKFGDITVWEVKGKYIRDNIDIEFTNYGNYFMFDYVPKLEFWIDMEADKNETQYFIDHLLVSYRLMSKGNDYEYSENQAYKYEQLERLKNDKIYKTSRKLIKNLEIENLGYYRDGKSNKIEIDLIRGDLFREAIPKFTEGGHHFVYNNIPENKVYIDDDSEEDEIIFFIIHEVYEREEMLMNGLTYNEAHKLASKVEWKARHNKEYLLKWKKILNLNF